jgi:hypothetical protein
MNTALTPLPIPKPCLDLQFFNSVSAMFRLTAHATSGRFSVITGGNCPTSGYSPPDSAPTARPRMVF